VIIGLVSQEINHAQNLIFDTIVSIQVLYQNESGDGWKLGQLSDLQERSVDFGGILPSLRRDQIHCGIDC